MTAAARPGRGPRRGEPVFFETPARFRAFLEDHHGSERELLVGFYKRSSGKPSLTWPESVDEALCFGWIDGVRRSLDAESYVIRFTPRRAKSIWSSVNVARMRALLRAGRVQPPGRKAFEERDRKRSGIYAYEQRKTARLSPALEREFRANTGAWRFFQTLPPWYRRTTTWWVTSAKKEETRKRRLGILIACSARRESIRELRRRPAENRSKSGRGATR
jgi:uncharacterized protein YdeI (YjbR/CyaY-like superfamily)